MFDLSTWLVLTPITFVISLAAFKMICVAADAGPVRVAGLLVVAGLSCIPILGQFVAIMGTLYGLVALGEVLYKRDGRLKTFLNKPLF